MAEHVDEVFQHAGDGAVVFGGDDMQAGSVEDPLLHRLELGGFGGIGGGGEHIAGEFGQGVELGRDARLTVVGQDHLRDAQGVGAGPVGAADDEDGM
jgi:hypothetical protein